MTDEMTFLDHLTDLRKRIVRALLGVVVGFLIVYGFAEELFDWLMQPLCGAFENHQCQLITIGVAEAFFVYLKTGVLGGIFLSAPWVFFQLWLFIAPGLHSHEKKLVIPFVLAASLMFVGGAAFGYFFVFPFAFDFFLGVVGQGITPTPGMDAYFGFASSLLFAFGALFEVPVIVVLLNILGVVQAKSLWGTWRYALVGIFALSAILTPADPFTMVLLAVPLSILYMGSLVVCSLLERSRKRRVQAEA